MHVGPEGREVDEPKKQMVKARAFEGYVTMAELLVRTLQIT